MRSNTTRVTAEGQITIPRKLLDSRGISAGTQLEVSEDGEDIVLRKAERRTEHGSGEDKEFREYLKGVRGSADLRMSTDEYMQFLRGE